MTYFPDSALKKSFPTFFFSFLTQPCLLACWRPTRGVEGMGDKWMRKGFQLRDIPYCHIRVDVVLWMVDAQLVIWWVWMYLPLLMALDFYVFMDILGFYGLLGSSICCFFLWSFQYLHGHFGVLEENLNLDILTLFNKLGSFILYYSRTLVKIYITRSTYSLRQVKFIVYIFK